MNRPFRYAYKNYRHEKQYAKSERAGRLFFSRDIYSSGSGTLQNGPRHHVRNLAGGLV